MRSPSTRLLPLVVVASLFAAPSRSGGDGFISRTELERVLARAVTMEGMLHGHGDLDDQIRFLKNTGARFSGRTLYLWGGEQNLEALLATAGPAARRVHAALPELLLQAAVFEIVTTQVEKDAVPASTFEAFELPVETRSFKYGAMLDSDGRGRDRWAKGSSVPDVSQLETRLWFFTLAARYIDAGVEAIHFGQVDLMDRRDPGHKSWRDLLDHVRAYARTHARRGFVLCDAHVPTGGIVEDGALLFDFHSFPLRMQEAADPPQAAVLAAGHLDAIYGRSKGGRTPSGWSCDHLPYLVEFDNWGRSGREGARIGGIWIWGYDEIGWFAHQNASQRAAWLRYAWKWIGDNDPSGHLEMPGSRTLAAPVGEKRWYWASDPGPACPEGFGDEKTIRAIWAASS
jgi:hypothetical protein